MFRKINGYTCIIDYNTRDIMVELCGIWHNARNALACQAYWDLYEAAFGGEDKMVERIREILTECDTVDLADKDSRWILDYFRREYPEDYEKLRKEFEI